MKKILLYCLVPMCYWHCDAQINFEKGYFIDNEGKRNECLIRDAEWKNNPTRFEYRSERSDASAQMAVADVQEFGFNDGVVYIRAVVKIDRSSDDLDKLTTSRNPVWSEEQVFLKLLTTGKASLYLYEEGNMRRFFYTNNESPIRQLIFKKYLLGNDVATNNDFRQQLWSDMNCNGQQPNTATALSYKQAALMRYFQAYNECNGISIKTVRQVRAKRFFHLSVTPGVTVAKLKLRNVADDRYGPVIFPIYSSLRIGSLMEFTLPYNKNKWAVLIEPGIQYFNGEGEPGTAAGMATVAYRSFEFPIGARYYFFLAERKSIFVNGFLAMGVSFKSFFAFKNDPYPKEIIQKLNPAIGAGYRLERLSLEFRFNINRDITRDYINWKSSYNTASLIAGFKLF